MKGKEGYGGLNHTTNNAMELLAIKEAIQSLYVPGVEELLVYSDSEYAINSLTTWQVSRQKKKAKKKKIKEFKNGPLIDSILAIMRHANVRFEWVRGHTGDIGNEEADRLAFLGSGLPMDMRTKPFYQAEPEHVSRTKVKHYLERYSGRVSFLKSLQRQLSSGRTLSDKQIAVALNIIKFD